MEIPFSICNIYLYNVPRENSPVNFSETPRMKKSDFSVIAIIYAIGIGFLIATFQLPEAARTYPLVLISALLLLVTLYAIGSIKKYLQDHVIEDDVKSSFKDFLSNQFFGVIAGIFAYMVGIYFIGFYPSTLIYMIGAMLLLRIPIKFIAATIVIVIAVIYGVFTMFLKVPLPLGIFFE